jgi:alpha-D-ribose 1-methylphosphonate 5-triphosphate synthase subunit PhnG
MAQVRWMNWTAVAGTTAIATLTTLFISQPGFAKTSRSLPSSQEMQQLRAQGPAGLQKFLATYQAELSPHSQQLPQPALRHALDTLCQQRDCHASRLYWYTDFAQAKAAAQASKKPILSLRLLGHLDEELSCANSRFFRIALYSNPEISQYLRDRYVLHWQSVRPVPQVTIDFGDGRTLKRTLTGNSIHYVLDAEGNPIDALPGLYSPQAFLKNLQQANQQVQQLATMNPRLQARAKQNYYRDRISSLQTQWMSDLQRTGLRGLPQLTALPAAGNTAVDAGRVAMTKMIVEMPLVGAAMGFSNTVDRNREQLNQATNQATWQKIAQRYQGDAKLDRTSINLIRSKNKDYRNLSEAMFQTTVQNLETAIALDTVRNQYLLQPKIYQWLLVEGEQQTLDQLNDRVYSELFLTPNQDPWLGLVSSQSYSAIEEDGK